MKLAGIKTVFSQILYDACNLFHFDSLTHVAKILYELKHHHI